MRKASQGRKREYRLSRYCHFERSEKSSLHTGQIKNVRGAVNTVLHTTWNDGLPHMYVFPACKKDSSAALGMTKREDGLPYISFHPAARANLRPFGAPPSRGRREKFKILFPHGEGSETRIPPPRIIAFPSRGKASQGRKMRVPPFPVLSFRAKREIFFAQRSDKKCEGSGKHRTACDLE